MTDVRAIVIGGSAGAIEVLLTVLPALQPPCAFAVVIVIHQLATQGGLLVDVLARSCALPMRAAVDKAPLEPGVVFVAPPDYHLLIERELTLALSREPPLNYSRPSIDVTFESAADALGDGVVAIVLTGANHDGAAGAAAIVRAGGRVIVQDPASAHSPEMPQAALDACTPVLVGDPARIATWLRSLLSPSETS